MSRLPPPTLPRPSQIESEDHSLREIVSQAVPATIGHAWTTHNLLSRRITRTFNNGLFTAGLAAHLMDPQIWSDLLQLQAAVMQRLQQQNRAWLKGCAILMEDYAQIKQANTMSKLVEKQYNLMAQWSLLIGNQATNMIGLQENIEVDYGYWASQKLQP